MRLSSVKILLWLQWLCGTVAVIAQAFGVFSNDKTLPLVLFVGGNLALAFLWVIGLLEMILCKLESK